MKPLYKILAASALALSLTACFDDDEDSTTAVGTIVDVAVDNGSFTTLVAALQATKLDIELADDSKTFTVFAPTDAAFEALLADLDISAADLLADPNLSDILLYHVIPEAEIDSTQAIAAAADGTKVTMGNGDEMALSLTGADLFANLSKIIDPDVKASNGVIHAIDTVLLPPAEATTPTETIYQLASSNGDLTTLKAALDATGLNNTLDAAGNYTVFAPTNAAFDALGADVIATLLADLPTLENILLKHVVAGSVDSITAFTLNGDDVETLNGETVKLEIDSGVFTVDGAKVTTFDVRATNGIIHVIDAVILLD
jgi:transforming growth factor-beta-induced protein